MKFKRNLSTYSNQSLATTLIRIDEVVKDRGYQTYSQFKSSLTIYSKSFSIMVTAGELHEKEGERDVRFRGFVNNAKAYTCHSLASNVEVATSICDIVSKFGGRKIHRLPYKEETAVIKRIIDKMSIFTPEQLQSIHQDEWITMLQESNDAFEAELEIYLASKVDASKVKSATEQRKVMLEKTYALFQNIEFLYLVEPTDELTDQVKMIIEILNR